MRKFNTLTGFLLSKTSDPAKDPLVEFQGYSSIGDGGAAQWQFTGITGQTPSQSPAQLGDAKLTDADGNQWGLVIITTSFGSGYNAKALGVVMDGTTDDTLARQAMYNGLNSLGGGVAYYPEGNTKQSSKLTTYSNIKSVGSGIGVTTFSVDSSMPLTEAMYENANAPVNRVRQDSNIEFHNFTLDGSGRTYIQYPTAGYATKGACLQLLGVENPVWSSIEVTGHQSNGGISDLGCLNAKMLNLVCHGNGKTDDISSPVYVQSYGGVRTITDITKANPAVVTLNSNPPSSVANGTKVYIENVTGLDSIPDGEYTVANLSGRTFELQGIDTTSDSGFVMTHRTIMGEAGGTSNFVPSEGTIVDNYHAYDNLRSGITFNPVHGGRLEGIFRDNGESTIFSTYAQDITLDVNIDGTTLTDIASAGVELNYCAGVTINGLIANTALDGVSILGCDDVTVNCSLRNIVKDNTITYPVGPLSVAAGIDGNVIDKLDGVAISSLLDTPCTNIKVNTKSIDKRPVAQARSCVSMTKAGTDNIVSDIQIINSDFSESGIVDTGQVVALSDNSVIPYKVEIKNNMGHTSQGVAVKQETISATGIQTFNLGFVPSLIEVIGVQLGTTNERTCQSFVVRDRVNISSGSLGLGQYTAADGLESSSTVDIDANSSISTNDFYRITDGSNAVVSLAEFSAWVVSSAAIGVNMNVITANSPVRLTLVFHP